MTHRIPGLRQPALFMAVRREIAESGSETGSGYQRNRGIHKQYVEVAMGEPARLAAQSAQLARRSSESGIAAEAFMNNAG